MTLEEIDASYHDAALDEEAEAWPDEPDERRDRRTSEGDEGAVDPSTGGTGAP